MIVYKRNLTKDDFNDIEKNELLFYKDNNIAYVITKNDSYILKKYKIFCSQIKVNNNSYYQN